MFEIRQSWLRRFALTCGPNKATSHSLDLQDFRADITGDILIGWSCWCDWQPAILPNIIYLARRILRLFLPAPLPPPPSPCPLVLRLQIPPATTMVSDRCSSQVRTKSCKVVWTEFVTDSWHCTPSQPRRSYQGEIRVIRSSEILTVRAEAPIHFEKIQSDDPISYYGKPEKGTMEIARPLISLVCSIGFP